MRIFLLVSVCGFFFTGNSALLASKGERTESGPAVTMLGHSGKITVNAKFPQRIWKLPAEVITPTDGSVQLEVDHIVVELKSSSQLNIYTDDQTQGLVFELLNGDAIIENTAAKSFVLRTPISEAESSVSKMRILYKKPEFHVSVEKGQFTLRGLGADESVEVQSGEKAFLIAQLENGGDLVFDTLLAGKKVVRAALSQTEKLSAGELKELKVNLIQRKKKFAGDSPLPSTFICRKPHGKLDECHWWCDHSQLLRERCNANGAWSDKATISANCGKTSEKIAVCDY